MFATTAIFSLFAYMWLFAVLSEHTGSANVVTLTEAIWTFSFFIILVVLAFGADKVTQYFDDKQKSQEDLDAQAKMEEKKVKKSALNNLRKRYGEKVVIEIAQGISDERTKEVPEQVQQQIREYFGIILEKNPADAKLKELHEALQPDSLLERFAARKANATVTHRDFLEVRGVKGQIEELHNQFELESVNDLLGFKCLSYAVTEATKHVEVCIVKKEKAMNSPITVGIRTVDGTGKAGENYQPVEEEVVTLK